MKIKASQELCTFNQSITAYAQQESCQNGEDVLWKSSQLKTAIMSGELP
jgi:hypothetical protein